MSFGREKKDTPSIHIFSYPISIAFETPLYNLYNILNEVRTYDIYLNIIKEDSIKYPRIDRIVENSMIISPQRGLVKKIGAVIRRNAFACNILLKKLKRGDIALFFMENGAIIPCILAKILGITTVKLLPSGIAHSGWQEMPSISSGLIYGLYVFENPWFDKIGIYGPNLITEWNLEYIYKKILIISEHLVDTNEFNIKIEYSSRPNYIAYIGRFSLEKGICNFLSSLPQIIAVNDEIGIWIIGDGELKDEVTSYLRRNSSYANIELLPWAEHRMLPAILNTIRLVVIPSYTEGLPNLLLEAMACGTPAIVSSVGIIPSIIIDDVNGYTLENNRPESIAYTVTKALQKKDMEVIAMKARKTIEDNFAKEVVTKKWEDLLRNLR